MQTHTIHARLTSKGVDTMAKTVCKDCTKRHLGCHDRCEDYQSSKPKYKYHGFDDALAYEIDKHRALKRDYGGRG